MSYFYHDPDEWESVWVSRPCTTCGGDLPRCNGACNGAAYYEQRRRAPEDAARIKAAKRQRHEEAVLAEADAIRQSRGTNIGKIE
jgi:hypothetical protein